MLFRKGRVDRGRRNRQAGMRRGKGVVGGKGRQACGGREAGEDGIRDMREHMVV